jgi:long-chain acyl-CoA synthetase
MRITMAVPYPFDRSGLTTKSWHGVPVAAYADRRHSLGEILSEAARNTPDRLALVTPEVRLTYRELDEAAAAFAVALERDLGLHPGDRVALLLGNQAEWVIAFFGIAMARMIAVALNVRFTAHELGYMFEDSGAAAVVATPALWQGLASSSYLDLREVVLTDKGDAGAGRQERVFSALIEHRRGQRPSHENDGDEDDVAAIFYTSGTTGRPKGAMTTHSNFVHNAISCERCADVKKGSSSLIVVPLFHVTGCNSQLVTTLYMEGTAYLLPAFDAQTVLRWLSDEKIETFTAVPAIYFLLGVQPNFAEFDLSHLRMATYGGAPSPPELIRQLKLAMPNTRLGNGFGLTETSSLTTFLPHEFTETKAASVGFPCPVDELRIVDADGQDVAPGEAGELLVKGPNIVKGYWNKPEQTAETFAHGWLHTGDIARIDEDGCIYIVDRAKDMIIRGGENVYSVEVENVLHEHPAVLEAALVGVPDAIMGEEGKAFIVLKPGATATEEEIIAFTRERLARYKVPKYVEFRGEPLPRNPGGKVIKPALRDAVTA